jgi:hypothetical protein
MSEFPETNNLEGNKANPKEFPIASLREFLLPSQLVNVRLFEGSSLQDLDDKINRWIGETKSIVAIPSSVSKTSEGNYLIAISFVNAD